MMADSLFQQARNTLERGSETMSTERKPGSRAVRDPNTLERANQAPRHEGEAGARRDASSKGSTKTVSPQRAFKRKRRK